MTSQLESLGPGLAGRRRFLIESATREAWGHITRTVVVFIAAFVAGALIFLWMFEAAFANASPSVYDAWIFPLAVLFGACLLLVDRTLPVGHHRCRVVSCACGDIVSHGQSLARRSQ